MLHILFIASWYPNRNFPALGNFIQRHAAAAGLHHKISVVHVCADRNQEEGKTEISVTENGNVSEFLVYFGKIRSGVPVVSQLKRRKAHRAAMHAGVEAAIKKNGKPDLVHVHVIWPAAVGVMPLLEDLNVPLVITEHWSGYLPEDGNYRGASLKFYSRRLVNKAAHITVVSRRMQEALQSHGLHSAFSILPNTVDTEIFRPPEKRNNGKLLRLLHVSMLVDREKNISGLLRVMERLKKHPEISLDIIGEGPERTAHEAQAKASGILDKTVFFRGFKTPEEIAQAMQTADALVMFSHFEGMPVTIIEAQCCGLPVIATRTGAIPEMVDGTQGMLVDPADEAGLEKAILLFSASRDTFSPKHIRETAVQRYSLQAVGDQLDRLYRSTLSKDGRE